MNKKGGWRILKVLAVGLCVLMGVASVHAADELAVLRRALTHHASFDRELRADYSRGDPVLYSYTNTTEREQGGKVAQPQEGLLMIAKGAGRYRGALLWNTPSPLRLFYRGEGMLGYNKDGWSGSISVWLRTSPDVDLAPGYCDPLQIVGGPVRTGFIFLEWSKSETPRHFRFAIQPLQHLWNPGGIPWEEIPYKKRPMVQVERAPFSRARWTHVVLSFENINNRSKPQRGRLHIDGQLQGSIENLELTLDWEADRVGLVLGAAYVGHMDDLSVFSQAVTDEEIQLLHKLSNGVSDLYRINNK